VVLSASTGGESHRRQAPPVRAHVRRSRLETAISIRTVSIHPRSLAAISLRISWDEPPNRGNFTPPRPAPPGRQTAVTDRAWLADQLRQGCRRPRGIPPICRQPLRVRRAPAGAPVAQRRPAPPGAQAPAHGRGDRPSQAGSARQHGGRRAGGRLRRAVAARESTPLLLIRAARATGRRRAPLPALRVAVAGRVPPPPHRQLNNGGPAGPPGTPGTPGAAHPAARRAQCRPPRGGGG
jgi:hypothetical protein